VNADLKDKQAMISNVTKEEMAVATGSEYNIFFGSLPDLFPVTYLFRTTGQVLGVSLSGALLQAVLTHQLRERLHGSDAAEVRT
jgi:hypothetical protein